MLLSLGADLQSMVDVLTGIEIVPEEAQKARENLKGCFAQSFEDCIHTDDFFSWWRLPGRPQYDAIVGNPPFIRYQSFPEPCRSRAMEIMHELGLSPNRLTNIWVPFVVVSIASLKDGGRMALVLPAELLQVSYAAQLRSYLTDKFQTIDLIACNELFFNNVEQEVVLLLADGSRATSNESNPCRVTLTETRNITDITRSTWKQVIGKASPKTIRHDSEKWLKYFLSEQEITLMRVLRSSDLTTQLENYASVNVGVVTGKNQFFVLRQSQVNKHRLHDYVVPIVSRSFHLPGAVVSEKDWKQLVDADELVNLLYITENHRGSLPSELESYIRYGESISIHMGYKCSIRDPWYAVPSVWKPDCFVFRQIYDFPRIVLNAANTTSTDTIHRVRCRVEPEKVVAFMYTYLTAASAEIEGRSYGGGVLELEPNEAKRLLVPSMLGKATLAADECDGLVRDARLDDLLEVNSSMILRDQMGLSQRDCNMLRGIWEKMRNRRLARKRSGRSRNP